MQDTIKTEIIENYMKEHNLSKNKFCKMCNVNIQTLNKILKNDFRFRVNALFKIARVLKIEVYQMFNG